MTDKNTEQPIKFLIYGHKGWIGSQVLLLLDHLKYTYVTGSQRADDIEKLEDEITQVKPTHVICLIGRTWGQIGDTKYMTIDYLEQPGKLLENVRDNLSSPLILAILSTKHHYHLTYMGTGCIFEYSDKLSHPFGKEINGFTEQDQPNFFGSSYSVVKGFTDKIMHLLPVLNIRIRMPITADPGNRNFITKITTYEKVCSIPNSMTVLPELLPMMIDMATKNIIGTINLTNPGLISHNEILEMYKEIVDPSFTWKNFSVEEQDLILAAGRSNNYLDTTKLQSMYPQVKNIKESVRLLLLEMAKSRKNACE